MKDKELDALIALLEDPDKEVSSHVFLKLSSLGEKIIPTLESAWEEAFDSYKQQRIEDLIHKIQFESLLLRVEDWATNKSDDLLLGALLVAQFQFPDVDEEKIRREIEIIRQDIWVELNANLTPLEEVNVFNQIFYGLNKFTGSTNFQDPNSSYLNIVLDTRKGNSLSLGILYLILAQQLNLPIYGVDLPNHFILAYSRYHVWEVENVSELRKHIQFYINPLNKGLIFTQNEIKLYLKKMELGSELRYFIPTDNRNILKNLLRQIGKIYADTGNKEKYDELIQLADAIDEQE